MEDSSTKEEYSGTYVNSETRGSYETVQSGAWKTWHGGPHVGAKGGGSKGRRYISAYASEVDRNKKAEI